MKMKIGFYQYAPIFGKPEENRDHLREKLTGVEADIIVLPELAFSGYYFSSPREALSLAEPVPGPSTHLLTDLAQKTGAVYVSGIAELADTGVYNSGVMVGPEGVIGTYRKLHLFNEEKLHFKPGDGGFFLHKIKETVVAVLVCFDHMFPEAARSVALQGADIVCHPSNLVLPEYAQLTTRVRSIENRVFWVLCNRYGSETGGTGNTENTLPPLPPAGGNEKKSLTFTGDSRIFAPGGRVLAQAGAAEESLQIVEIDPREAREKRLNPFNDLLQDRRPDVYTL